MTIEGINGRPEIRVECRQFGGTVVGSTLPFTLRNLSFNLETTDCYGCNFSSTIAIAAADVFVEDVSIVLSTQQAFNDPSSATGFLQVAAIGRAFFQDLQVSTAPSPFATTASCFCTPGAWPASVDVQARDVIFERCEITGSSASESRTELGCSSALNGSPALRLRGVSSSVLINVDLFDGLGGDLTTAGAPVASGAVGGSILGAPDAIWNSSQQLVGQPTTAIGGVAPPLRTSVGDLGTGTWSVSNAQAGSIGMVIGPGLISPLATPLGTLLVQPTAGLAAGTTLFVPISASLIGQRYGVQSIVPPLTLGPASWGVLGL